MAVFVVPESLKKMVGQTEEPIVFKVEEGAIQRYARAVGDTNPLYNDVEHAARSRWGRLLAPPAFAGWPVKSDGFDMIKFVEKLIKAGAPAGLLDGGVDYEFFSTVAAGDTLIAVTKIESIEGRETKLGPTMITTVETMFTNQGGGKAFVMRNMFLNF
ncbi:MAG: MaoC family dehydratase N-terminal domain-containing protein [Dehalococcoidia bacterium]|jgi:acyl dehydratase